MSEGMTRQLIDAEKNAIKAMLDDIDVISVVHRVWSILNRHIAAAKRGL